MNGHLRAAAGRRFGLRVPTWAGVLTVGICLVAANYTLDVQRERNAADALKQLGGTVHYAWRLDDRIKLTSHDGQTPRWLVPGDAYVDGVTMTDRREDLLDAKLVCLRSCNHLRWLSLARSRITDATLEHTARLSSLEWLDLRDTPITDVGLSHLRRVPQIKWLDLSNTLVTDASLPQLAMLKQLELLDLRGTRVTSQGLKLLRHQLPTARIVPPVA